MDEFSPKIRALIEQARAADEPSARDRARVRGKLAVSAASLVGTVGASLAAKSAAAATGAKAAGLGVAALAKWTAGLVVAVAVGAGTYQVVTSPESGAASGAPSESSLSSEKATRGEPRVVMEEVSPKKEVAATPFPSVSPPRHLPPSRGAGEGNRKATAPERGGPIVAEEAGEKPRSEVESLARAQGKLARGQAAEALELVLAHRREFPRSALSAERLAVQVLALCQLGRTLEAERAFEEFERLAPSSPLGPRLLASCAGVSRRSHDSDTIPPLTGN
jgi:hypothetical protein